MGVRVQKHPIGAFLAFIFLILMLELDSLESLRLLRSILLASFDNLHTNWLLDSGFCFLASVI